MAGAVGKLTEHAGRGGRLYAAVLGELHAETDGVIGLPVLGANSEEELAAEDQRWSLPDWNTVWAPWLPEERWRHWEQALTDAAGRSSARHWERTFDRYLIMLTRVCKRVRRQLRADGVVDRHFVVVVLTDDDEQEDLLRRILGVGELYRLFPGYDRERAWMSEVEAKSPAERAVCYVQAVCDGGEPIDPDRARRELRDLGRAALPALGNWLAHGPDRWQAAKVLADIGCAADEVIEPLVRALRTCTGADQFWSACALSRLGRLDVVLADPGLGGSVVAAAAAAPYRAFRDDALCPPPLDYGPLAQLLTDRPQLSDALVRELRPGSSYCTIRAEEADTAIEARRSPHPVIRRHAAGVLGERKLGAAVGRHVIPHLAAVATDDPDATTRRLALLSLHDWKHDARHYTSTIRQALHDPDAGVRATAQHCLDQSAEQS
ncbi:DUF4303 domain-containing protein [Streptomyces sp. NPDC055189]